MAAGSAFPLEHVFDFFLHEQKEIARRGISGKLKKSTFSVNDKRGNKRFQLERGRVTRPTPPLFL